MSPDDVIPVQAIPWAVTGLVTLALTAASYLLKKGFERELARFDAKASADRVLALEASLADLRKVLDATLAEHRREIDELRRRVHNHATEITKDSEQIRALNDRLTERGE